MRLGTSSFRRMCEQLELALEWQCAQSTGDAVRVTSRPRRPASSASQAQRFLRANHRASGDRLHRSETQTATPCDAPDTSRVYAEPSFPVGEPVGFCASATSTAHLTHRFMRFPHGCWWRNGPGRNRTGPQTGTFSAPRSAPGSRDERRVALLTCPRRRLDHERLRRRRGCRLPAREPLPA
jgi:hypothetical protein